MLVKGKKLEKNVVAGSLEESCFIMIRESSKWISKKSDFIRSLRSLPVSSSWFAPWGKLWAAAAAVGDTCVHHRDMHVQHCWTFSHPSTAPVHVSVEMHGSVRPHLVQISGFALSLAFFNPFSECMAYSFTRSADHSQDLSSSPADCDAEGHGRSAVCLSVCLSHSVQLLLMKMAVQQDLGPLCPLKPGRFFP